MLIIKFNFIIIMFIILISYYKITNAAYIFINVACSNDIQYNCGLTHKIRNVVINVVN